MLGNVQPAAEHEYVLYGNRAQGIEWLNGFRAGGATWARILKNNKYLFRYNTSNFTISQYLNFSKTKL